MPVGLSYLYYYYTMTWNISSIFNVGMASYKNGRICTILVLKMLLAKCGKMFFCKYCPSCSTIATPCIGGPMVYQDFAWTVELKLPNAAIMH